MIYNMCFQTSYIYPLKILKNDMIIHFYTTSSQIKPVTRGAIQGSILRTLLFIFHIKN